MHPQVLFQNRKPDRINTLEEYRRSGGYQALADVLKNLSPKDVQQKLLDALLLGRGGAAFPAGRKLMTVAEDAPFPRYIVCNADEMEPGTFKDRVLIHADPHMLIEGMVIDGYAARAQKGVIFIRPEYEGAAAILEREIENARTAGYLGPNILDSGYAFDLVVHRSGGRYICGEVTAQLRALEGKRPNPKQPPPYPTEKGLWGRPTVLQNVETLACIPHIIRNGAEWFRNLALTATGAGTKIFCVSGKVNRPGCFELPMGIRLSEIIEVHAGGMRNGAKFKACLPGGASTAFLSEQFYDIEMDFESMRKAGHRLGTGAIMVFDHNTCLVAATLNLTEFFARESCGWCTPCREGFPYMRDLLWRIENGQGETEFVTILRQMCRHLWNSYCAFAPGGVAPIESLLTYFEDEVQAHIRAKKCPFGSI
ncbi:MAG: NADH-ubiquinone oxidoreductase-F iron-sulfur binding region domain-containing protein [Pseudomonadota bacterium]|uniref:SLBB domain-containing protein n=1 Tax=Candidatus Desulfatibia profunda TaxID=2841695 RepID=A0A8J6NNL7_9BACT|nr:SLBB domain-containing protein [Candidatus Desulfatibia profunda]MBL7180407.1 SLBB domain-containing protein [Desulfobacterales bacterium]